VNIYEVQGLLGRRHLITPQIDDKRRRTTAESASNDLHFCFIN
jgi:hypothetical protein